MPGLAFFAMQDELSTRRSAGADAGPPARGFGLKPTVLHGSRQCADVSIRRARRLVAALGQPRALFTVPNSALIEPSRRFGVSPAGTRFLMNLAVAPGVPPITLFVNWQAYS